MTYFILEELRQREKHSFPGGSGRAGAGDQREMRSPASAAAGREDHCHFLEEELTEIGKTGKYSITQTFF